MNAICIITARGGSKRIPKKNIKEFFGKPIIAYAIETALCSKLFEEVMVSTDDSEISDIAIRYGATIPFMRSRQNSDDYSTTSDVLNEVIKCYKKIGKNFHIMSCIYPCSPLLTTRMLKDAMAKFKSSNANYLMPICEFQSSPQRCIRINEYGYLERKYPQYDLIRTQDLEPMYYDPGIFYIAKVKSFMKDKKLLSNKTIFYEVPSKFVQDIDTLEDWNMLELKYRILNNV